MANTSAPLSETAIANMAGSVLEDRPLTSLDDGSPFGKFVAREFGYVRDELIASHSWHWCRKFIRVAPLVSTPPFQWTYSYSVPGDLVRLEPIRYYYPNGPKIPYSLVGQEIYTDKSTSLDLVYGARVTNAALFDPLFARLLAGRLAVLAAMRITGKAQYYDKAADMLRLAEFEAKRGNAYSQGEDEYMDDGENGRALDSISVRGRGLG